MKAFVAFTLLVVGASARQIAFQNNCGQPIWISPLTKNDGPELGGGIQRVDHGRTTVYQIPDGGWTGRFWPKTGCGNDGHDCRMGQSMPPCPPINLFQEQCQPPADTKVEFFFPQLGTGVQSWYYISLVDGYSLPARVTPSVQDGSCVTTSCNITLADCPDADNAVGDLRVQSERTKVGHGQCLAGSATTVVRDGATVQCLSPCKKWTSLPPYGMDKPEEYGPGLHFSCPTPPIWPEQCRGGPVDSTHYVKLVHEQCPSAYSWAYDDKAGPHNCPNYADFTVQFCG